MSQDTVKSGGVFLYAHTTGKDSCYCLHVYSQCNVCLQLGKRERERERETIQEGERVKMKHIHVPYLILGSESVRLSSQSLPVSSA